MKWGYLSFTNKASQHTTLKCRFKCLFTRDNNPSKISFIFKFSCRILYLEHIQQFSPYSFATLNYNLNFLRTKFNMKRQCSTWFRIICIHCQSIDIVNLFIRKTPTWFPVCPILYGWKTCASAGVEI